MREQEVRWVLVDEMPIRSASDLHEFFTGLCSMMTLYAQRNPTRPLSFAFSSVNDPRVGFAGSNRIAELLKVIKFPAWRRVDLKAPIALISTNTELTLTVSQIDELIGEANGSPRFAKIFVLTLLNICAFRNEARDAFDEALVNTRMELTQ